MNRAVWGARIGRLGRDQPKLWAGAPALISAHNNIVANYSQWNTERAPSSKKVNLVEEINSLSEKVDALMKLVSNKNAPIDLNGVPFPTLISKIVMP